MHRIAIVVMFTAAMSFLTFAASLAEVPRSHIVSLNDN